MSHARYIFFIFLTAQLLGLSALHAQDYDRVPWRSKRITLTAHQRPVRDVLKEFATLQSLPVSISESVKGVISGTFMEVDTARLLDQICEAHGLVWFYDGVRMIIETGDEVFSRPLSLPYVTAFALNEVLFSVGYASGPKGREVQIKNGHREGVILLIGGAQFIQATEALARDLDTQESRRINDQITVRTFRLNYASASDVTVNNGGTTRIIPGVVRNLQNLMANQVPGSQLSAGVEEAESRRTHPSLRGTGLAAVGNPNAGAPLPPFNPYDPYGTQQKATPVPGFGGAGGAVGQPAATNDPRAPMIVADVRLNAVLVRDVAARMPLYEELIRMIDVPTKAIEISAAIVDIGSDNLRNVGVEILGLGKKGNDNTRFGFDADRGLFDGTNTQGQTPSFLDGSNLARGAGLNATALISAGGFEMLSRLRAVEEVGAAQIVSSPSVLTMENVQAVIRTDEKVYVKVAGNLQVDLFDVTAGVQLRVTPTLVKERGNTDFRLVIDITDGSFSDQRVGEIPTTRESAINTQALVPENKTLLLGGYSVERRNRSSRQVPLLAKVPLLGKIFSNNARTHERTQRFFFITPRIVDLMKEATDPAAFVGTAGNDLALPSYLNSDQISREKVDDLARRLAAGNQAGGDQSGLTQPRAPQTSGAARTDNEKGWIPRALPLREEPSVLLPPASNPSRP